ncbi:MAG: nucleoside triphosphate pyrophosphohydrolase [Ruminococcus sp.]|jgi:tetrapyrrole methylase family protein/MazG family protein|nr:nucleoside triphosphate pyrophosphohydrolase [Ruminococcus sp.]
MNFTYKSRYNIDDLIEIVKLLRSPDGCPWDKVQTHKTIRNDLIEECYEAVEAIDTDNPALLREELGDVLLQVVFHSDIEADKAARQTNEATGAADNGEEKAADEGFTFDDVANDICVKLITRHPHVFGDVLAKTPEEVLKNWDSIKKLEKNQETAVDTLNAVSKSLPALMRAEKVIKRAYRAGYSHTTDEILDKIRQILDNVNNSDNIDKDMGDILLNICETCFLSKIFPEQVLTEATERYIIDFGLKFPE